MPDKTAENTTLLKPASWLSRVDFINHLVLFNNVMMAIVADKNGGKTSFVRMLTHALDEQIQSCIVNAGNAPTTEAICEQLKTNFAWLSNCKPELAAMVRKINQSKKQLLLIIDDAQFASLTCLEDLVSQIQAQGDKGCFHVLLTADPSLNKPLAQLGNEYRELIHSMALGNLSVEETRTYLAVNSALSLSGFQDIYQATQGNIALINAAMDSQHTASTTQSKSPRKRAVFAIAASFAITGLGAGYIWQNHTSLLHKFSPQLATVKAEPVFESEVAGIDFVRNARPIALKSVITPFYVAATRQKVQPPPLTKIFASVFETEEEYVDGLGVIDKVLVIPKALTRNGSDSNTVLISEVAAVNFPIQPHPLDLGQKSGTLSRGYTIQLIACRNKAEAGQFLKKYPLASQSGSLRKAKRNGQDWYVLTLGEYTDFQQAKSALGQLPKNLSQLKPWIRPISGLGRA